MFCRNINKSPQTFHGMKIGSTGPYLDKNIRYDFFSDIDLFQVTQNKEKQLFIILMINSHKPCLVVFLQTVYQL
ncbi:hypothetical protein D3C76_1812840 [compost metagenome]